MAKKEETVKVTYVGKKPFAADNVAHSGKMWHGRGDVQEVTAAQAAILLRYPDQWQAGDKKLPTESEIEERLAKIAPVQGGVGVTGKRLEDMESGELASHAAHYYGLMLDPKLPKEDLLEQLNEAVRTAAQDAEFARNKALDESAPAGGEN